MELSFASLQFAMLALPGILWASLEVSTFHHKRTTTAQFWVKVFTFGVVTYAILALIYKIVGADFHAFDFQAGPSASLEGKADEIVWSIPLAMALALLWIAGKTHLWIPRVLRWSRISDSAGCEDIWEYALGNQSPVGKWVHFRDVDRIYEGKVKAYSDGPEVRELLLAHVTVYNLDGEVAYDQHAVYVSRPATNMDLEFCLEKPDA